MIATKKKQIYVHFHCFLGGKQNLLFGLKLLIIMQPCENVFIQYVLFLDARLLSF